MSNGEYTSTWQDVTRRFPMGSPSYREAMNKIREEQLNSFRCANQLDYAGARAAESSRCQVEEGLNFRH